MTQGITCTEVSPVFQVQIITLQCDPMDLLFAVVKTELQSRPTACGYDIPCAGTAAAPVAETVSAIHIDGDGTFVGVTKGAIMAQVDFNMVAVPTRQSA